MIRIIKTIKAMMTVLAIPFILSMTACSGNDYLNAIPEESTLLISMNPAKLTGTGSPLILKSLLHVSKLNDSGLDLSANVFFFEDARANIGVCAKVSDDDKLEDLLKQAHLNIIERRGFKFAALPSNWVIGFSDKAALLMGPALPAAQSELMTQMAKYLGADEDDGVKSSPLFDKLDSIDAPMAMVSQVQALPEQLVMPFTIGAPRDTDPSDILVAASMQLKDNQLMMQGETYSLKKDIDKALKDARKIYRPIKGAYVKAMSQDDVLGMFLNVDGQRFHSLISQNRGISALLAGINSAIDMDNILKSFDGDMTIVSSALAKGDMHMMMAAKLSNAKWLDDVDYWKQSVPEGGYIGDWGKNCFYYKDSSTSYYFGVTPDLQYMSGGNPDEARASIKACANPISPKLQRQIVGQKLVMVINFTALQGTKAEAVTALLKPMFGHVNTIVYTMK